MTRTTQSPDVDLSGADNEELGLGLAAMLWRRKWIVAALIVIGGVLGLLYCAKVTPMYQSFAQVLLIQKKADLPVAGVKGEVSYENDVLTHAYLLASPLIVDKAVRKLDRNRLPSLGDCGDPTAVIAAGLQVAPAGSRWERTQDVLQLSYAGSNPDDCPVILNAVIDAYREFIGQTYQDFSQQTVELIAKAKDVLHEQLVEKESEYQKFRESSPLMLKNDEALNLHESRLVEIEAARSQALLKLTQTRARLDAISDALAGGGSRAALGLLVVGADSGGSGAGAVEPRNDFEKQLFAEMLEEQILLMDFGPDHPEVRAVRTRMNLIRERLGADPLPDGGRQHADFLALYMDSLRHEIGIAEREVAKLGEQFEQEREAAKSLASYKIVDENFRKEIDRTQKMFDGVMKRLEEIHLAKDYGQVTAEVISPPGVGGQIQPKRLVIETIALVFGALAGIALAYLVDVTDKAFRSPEDIRVQLGLPVLGHIPVLPRTPPAGNREAGDAGIDPTVYTFHDPKGQGAEAYRTIRTALYFDARREDRRLVQVTSPEVGDGKTTLAANLAVSAAKSGKRVLLMDADLRNPRVHKLFGLEGKSGLAGVLEGKDTLDGATRTTPVDNLWIVPCGRRAENPADLLTARGFAELLDVVRAKYDMVILDSPPLLAVTDPAVIAPRVDTVVLVTRLRNDARKSAACALEILASLGANVLGIVVNGVRSTRVYGYRYGKYAYAHRYDYQRRYGSPDSDVEPLEADSRGLETLG